MRRKAVDVAELSAELEKEPRGKLYKTKDGNVESRRAEISSAIHNARCVLDTVYKRGKVDLHNLEEVRLQTGAYLDACEQTGTIPTMMGLASAFGLSRPELYRYLDYNNNAETEYLESVRTAFASILAEASLKRNCDNITSIFLLKNSAQGLQNEIELTTQNNSVRPQMSEEELLRLAEMLPK